MNSHCLKAEKCRASQQVIYQPSNHQKDIRLPKFLDNPPLSLHAPCIAVAASFSQLHQSLLFRFYHLSCINLFYIAMPNPLEYAEEEDLFGSEGEYDPTDLFILENVNPSVPIVTPTTSHPVASTSRPAKQRIREQIYPHISKAAVSGRNDGEARLKELRDLKKKGKEEPPKFGVRSLKNIVMSGVSYRAMDRRPNWSWLRSSRTSKLGPNMGYRRSWVFPCEAFHWWGPNGTTGRNWGQFSCTSTVVSTPYIWNWFNSLSSISRRTQTGYMSCSCYRTTAFSMSDAVNDIGSLERLVGERCTRCEYSYPRYINDSPFFRS